MILELKITIDSHHRLFFIDFLPILYIYLHLKFELSVSSFFLNYLYKVGNLMFSRNLNSFLIFNSYSKLLEYFLFKTMLFY